mgnify:CR=1 FL=1
MNILLNGANGRMGNEIINAVEKQNDMKIVCGFDREENKEGKFPIYNKIDDIKEKSKAKFGHSKHFMYLCRQIKTKNNE